MSSVSRRRNQISGIDNSAQRALAAAIASSEAIVQAKPSDLRGVTRGFYLATTPDRLLRSKAVEED